MCQLLQQLIPYVFPEFRGSSYLRNIPNIAGKKETALQIKCSSKGKVFKTEIVSNFENIGSLY
jgi:hypothetical protein